MAALSTWSKTAGSNNSSPPDGAPEGWAPSAVNNVIRENMAQIRTWYEEPEWINDGDTYTRQSGTQVTSAHADGDVTGKFHQGRRVRVVGSNTGTIYGYVSSSSFSSPTTTINFTFDTSSIDSGDSTVTVSYSVVSADNPSLPISATTPGLKHASDGLAADIGTQANVEAQTAGKVLDASNAKYHPGVAKAWCKWNGTGATGAKTIDAGHNVASINKNAATGDFTITFTTAFSSANYVMVGTATDITSAGNDPGLVFVKRAGKAAGSVTILTYDINGTAEVKDYDDISIVCFGDQ